ncbi:hypothetical protein PCASD_19478 [Puccinia coronata f. sp. avenae]|uniref:DUF659 domain-containing protein n=1 Tax=Puccinia coronata f. sp. avenae TaxID=200324 RepID=A0A2N5UAF5_9BASI|nr:hypothetical protein PCASD_19478 [Puccinia coronata f. sp. avenae]
MANQRNRRKEIASSTSSVSSSPAPAQGTSKKNQDQGRINLDDDSDVKQLPTGADSTAGSTQNTKLAPLTDEQELTKHVASCTKKERKSQGTQKLAAMGILGTGDIDPQEVPQLCAIWCAQGARPFASLGESSHLGIVHPTVIKNLPKCRTVSKDIAKLYTAVQESLVELFKNHKGAMYLGLDAWQSPNGIDILGTVLYWLIKEEEGGFHLEAVLLDFVRLQKSHTGAYLAETSYRERLNKVPRSLASRFLLYVASLFFSDTRANPNQESESTWMAMKHKAVEDFQSGRLS